MKRIAVMAVALMALTGCAYKPTDKSAESSTPTLPATSAAETTSEAPATSTGPKRNERGNIVKAIGEEGGFGDENQILVTFAVDAIAPVECTEQFSSEYPSENGHLIALSMRYATAPELAASDMNYFAVNPNEFQFVRSDGVTISNVATTATYSCLNAGEMLTTSQMMPGSQYVGKIVLDVPEGSGTIVYRPLILADGSGWEWSI